MRNEQRPGDLKPRTIAVLVALRSGPKTANQLGTAIGDGSHPAARRATADLLVDMQRPSSDLIVLRDGRYYLDHAGLGWLQNHGLDAALEARAWAAAERCPGPDIVEPRLAVDVNVDSYGRRTVRRAELAERGRR